MTSRFSHEPGTSNHVAAQNAPTETENTATGPTFADLGLCDAILRTLATSGYTHPTPIQQQAIPAALAGDDVVACSPTGSGKTAAFMLPAIERLSKIQPEDPAPSNRASPDRNRRGGARRFNSKPARPALLVLTPTRELAMQVTTAAKTYGAYLKSLKTVSVLGGVPYPRQLEMLSEQPEIIVATPGRLIDHLERGRVDFSALSMLVLDEADRMLDMGFIDDIETIVAATPQTRQTLLFSATIDRRISSLTQRLLKNPKHIEIERRPEQSHNIAQSLYWTDDRTHKDNLLLKLLSDDTLNQAVIFTATKNSAGELSDFLCDAGFVSAPLHGDLPQSARTRTLKALRDQRVRILVATDVAARGIDVPTITHVFNYDLPKFAEDYVHRIGRTGRAGRTGIAVSLAHYTEMAAVRRIEQFTRHPLPVQVMAGLEPRERPKSVSRHRGGNNSGRGRPGNSSHSRYGSSSRPYNNEGGGGSSYRHRDGQSSGHHHAGGTGHSSGQRHYGDAPQGQREQRSRHTSASHSGHSHSGNASFSGRAKSPSSFSRGHDSRPSSYDR